MTREVNRVGTMQGTLTVVSQERKLDEYGKVRLHYTFSCPCGNIFESKNWNGGHGKGKLRVECAVCAREKATVRIRQVLFLEKIHFHRRVNVCKKRVPPPTLTLDHPTRPPTRKVEDE